MKEELITFETSKLAKEKGFTQLFGKFDLVDMFRENKDGSIESDKEMQGNERDRYYLRPTQSLLQKWLRENHNIQMMLKVFIDTKKKSVSFACDVVCVTDGKYVRSPIKDTYEDALELGLLHGLNLIN